jgi:hypothetical protein
VPGIEAINKKDVQAMGRKYLSSRQQAVAISGDAKAIKDQLALFGKVQIVTP